jgi:hypothetical protein
MVNVRPESGTPIDRGFGPDEGGAPGAGGRLNLLLSYAGWQPESWADRLPRLLAPMGIRTHRAQNGREASTVIQRTCIHIAVVDLGLPLDEERAEAEAPDAPPPEGGSRLLELLARLAAPPPTVVVKRSRTLRDDGREIAAALRAGAFAVVDRPRDPGVVEIMLEVMRRCLLRFYRGQWPGIV